MTGNGIPLDAANSAYSRAGITTGAGAFAGGRSAFVGGATFGGFGGVGFHGGFPIGRPVLGFGFPAFGVRFGYGGFGFGWGLGFGWGPCWGGAWAWDPFCFDSFGAWSAYGYYDYPPGPYAYPPSVGYDPNYGPGGPGYDPDNPPAPPQQSPDQGSPNASYHPAPYQPNPNWDTGVNAPRAAARSEVPVVIYLKDGSSLSPSDYWISDNRFHYVLGGQESSVDLSRVDLPRTNDANHQRGATFWLKSAPDADSTPAPGSEPAPAAPASRQDDNAVPGPAASPKTVPATAHPVPL